METMSNAQPEVPLALPELRDCFIARTNFRVNPTWRKQDDENAGGDLAVRLVVRRPSDLGVRQLHLLVSIKGTDENPAPYEVDLEVIGVLDGCEPVDDPTKADRHAAMVGTPILYATAREHLLNLSARSPHPRLLLPIQSTRGLIAQAEYQLMGDAKEGGKAKESPAQAQPAASG